MLGTRIPAGVFFLSVLLIKALHILRACICSGLVSIHPLERL